MIYVNTVVNEFFFGENIPSGSDWRQVQAEEFNSLRASGWEPTEYVPPHRVSKDTITDRIFNAGKLPDLISLISTLPTEQKFLWENYSWFWSTNQTIRGMATQIGLDPDVILAPDPYL